MRKRRAVVDSRRRVIAPTPKNVTKHRLFWRIANVHLLNEARVVKSGADGLPPLPAHRRAANADHRHGCVRTTTDLDCGASRGRHIAPGEHRDRCAAHSDARSDRASDANRDARAARQSASGDQRI
jgi:hypothetical protein